MAMWIKSERIYTERGLVDGAILMEYGKIRRIVRKELLPPGMPGDVVDYGKNRIIPGIIDLHTHGFMGWSANNTDPQHAISCAVAHASCGVTGFLMTNGKWPGVLDNNAMIANLMESEYPGARVLGIHMEGPFINPDRRGAFSDEGMTAPDLELCKAYYESSRGALKYMTLAPELPGNLEIIDYLCEKGVVVGAAHSMATYAETIAAIDRGLSVSIHTGNAMGPVHQREATLLGAFLLDDRVRCELICDFFHVCPETIRIFLKMKGKERMMMVSDSGATSGMPAGKYELPGEGAIYIEKDGLVHLENGTIAGSSLYVLYGIGNLVEKLGLPMEDVAIMSSLTPARVLGLEHKKGSIREKKDADFVVIDEDYKAIATYVEGTLAYDVNNHGELYNTEGIQQFLVERY